MKLQLLLEAAINAVLYVTGHGCKWRGLPERFGYWHAIHMQVNRWAKKGFWLMFSQCSKVPMLSISK